MHPRLHIPIILLRVFALLAMFMPIAPVAAGSGSGGDSNDHNAFVTATDVVNIRICPATDCAIVTSAKLGDPLDLIGNPVNGFLPVSSEGKRGFASALYITDQVEDTWFTQGEIGCKRVAFIFNVGIGDTPSQSVIDTLIGQRVPATMFPMGGFATAYPDYLRQLDRAGFPIGTHGEDPISLTGASDDQIASDLTMSLATISAATGKPVIPWATPYAADTDPRVRRITAQLGLVPVGWNVTAGDYDEEATADAVYSRVIDGVSDGAIVEFHLDGPATDTSTAIALPKIIATLKADGYTFVTVPDMATPCAPAD